MITPRWGFLHMACKNPRATPGANASRTFGAHIIEIKSKLSIGCTNSENRNMRFLLIHVYIIDRKCTIMTTFIIILIV